MASGAITLQMQSSGTATVKLMQGSSWPQSIVVFFLDTDGKPINLTGCVPIIYAGPNGANNQGTVMDAFSGAARFEVTPDMTAIPGQYACSFALPNTSYSSYNVDRLTLKVQIQQDGIHYAFLNQAAGTNDDIQTQINDLKTELSSKATEQDVQTSINGINIGAVQLLQNSATLPTLHGWSSNSSTDATDEGSGYYRVPLNSNVTEILQNTNVTTIHGSTYTESFYFKTDSTTLKFSFNFYEASNAKENIVQATIQSLGSGLYRAYATATVEDTAIRAIDIKDLTYTDGTYIDIGKPKFEYGNKVTDYSESDADFNSQIGTINTTLTSQQSEITQNANAISSKVEKTTYETDMGNVNSGISTAQSAANSKAKVFTSQPTPPYSIGDIWANPSGDEMVCTTARTSGGYTASDWTTASAVTLSRISTAESNITQTANSISSKVWETDITSAVSGIQVGGRNLLLNSNFGDALNSWTLNNPGGTGAASVIADTTFGHCAKIVSAAAYQGIYQSPHTRVAGTQYSWSVWLKADAPTEILISHESGEGGKTVSVGTSWAKYTGTGKWNGGGGAYCFYPTGATTYYAAQAKYEQGTIATDWSPAPEDVQRQIDTHTSEISQNATAISSKVEQTVYTSGMAGKADKSTLVSEINQSAEAIKISASKIDLTGYATFSSLETAGTTKINGDNIDTTNLKAQRIYNTSNDIYAEIGTVSFEDQSGNRSASGITIYSGSKYHGGVASTYDSNYDWIAMSDASGKNSISFGQDAITTASPSNTLYISSGINSIFMINNGRSGDGISIGSSGPILSIQPNGIYRGAEDWDDGTTDFHYHKYDDGTLIHWGYVGNCQTDITTAYGSTFWRHAYTYALPTSYPTFVGNRFVRVTITSSGLATALNESIASDNKTIQFDIQNPHTTTGLTFGFSYLVVGRWK